MSAKKNTLKVFSLGGLDEIGKNMTVLEYGNDIMIIDCGLAFPQDDMLGIDLVIPDFEYLKKNASKVRGVVLTHGHEDHVGAVPYFLRDLQVPIYGTKLTLGLIGNKLKEHNLTGVAELVCVTPGDPFKLGCFTVECIRTTHSIADSVAIAVRTPVGTVIHSGDFKIDYTPIQGQSIDLQRFAKFGMEGVLLFMCESTNVEQKGYTPSERTVGMIFEDIFEQTTDQRIMIATFASNIHRIQQGINCAVKQKRKVLVLGRSMVNAVGTATELGYLDIPDNVLIDVSEVKNYANHELLIITTGSQGEPMSALTRIASSDHRHIEICPGDKIIVSASPIPGNERTISRVINELMKKGADVIYDAMMNVHVSGHAKQEEIKLLHALIQPKYVMPVHGEYRHLKHHKELVVSMGMDKDNVFVLANGEVVEFTQETAKQAGTVPVGQVLIDGLGVGDVGNVVLRDRKHLAQDGFIIVVVGFCVDNGRIVVVTGPEITCRGFVYVKEAVNLLDEAKKLVLATLEDCSERNITDWNYLRNAIREALKDFLWNRIKRNPMILTLFMEL